MKNGIGHSTVARRTSWMEWLSWAIGLAMALLASACATTGATLGSGVGERFLDRPPYYSGAATPANRDLIEHLPVAFQRGATQPASFEPRAGEGSPTGGLLAEMNAYLDSLAVTAPLVVADAPGSTPPDVRFGCEQLLDECVAESDNVAVQGKPWMKLAVGRPSAEWTAAVAAALDRAGKEYALVVTLEVGQYWVRQRNLLGSKEARLGTAYGQDLPWLTSLDQPVRVVQLTGAVVGRDGKAVRIGAEGMFARQTHLVLSGFGARELITDEDVAHLATLRRDDLPGQPLVWRVALGNLVAELTGERSLMR